MDADADDRDMILQRCLPAGLHAPHHAIVPHLTAKLRENRELMATPPREECIGLHMGVADTRIRTPKTAPSNCGNLTGAVASGQFTVSYRVLPFSRRTVVGSPPQKETARIQISGPISCPGRRHPPRHHRRSSCVPENILYNQPLNWLARGRLIPRSGSNGRV